MATRTTPPSTILLLSLIFATTHSFQWKHSTHRLPQLHNIKPPKCTIFLHSTTRGDESSYTSTATQNDEDEDEDDLVLWSDDWDIDLNEDLDVVADQVAITEEEEEEEEKEEEEEGGKKLSWWESLSPGFQEILRKKGQERAIRNKMKRESKKARRKRLIKFAEKALRIKKRQSRIKRPTPFSSRLPLSSLTPGAEVDGRVISLTPFGAYVDVGTECDGLLHISQMSLDDFVEHPRQMLSPGDDVTVCVKSVNAEARKVQLTMLPLLVEDSVSSGGSNQRFDVEVDLDDVSEEEAIGLEDLSVDDELWGEIRRVTAYGAYVELGAVVDGFLHFMDHPCWGDEPNMQPKDFMFVGDRVRVWVSGLDFERKRIKLTGNRPSSLPGPRRELPRRP